MQVLRDYQLEQEQIMQLQGQEAASFKTSARDISMKNQMQREMSHSGLFKVIRKIGEGISSEVFLV